MRHSSAPKSWASSMIRCRSGRSSRGIVARGEPGDLVPEFGLVPFGLVEAFFPQALEGEAADGRDGDEGGIGEGGGSSRPSASVKVRRRTARPERRLAAGKPGGQERFPGAGAAAHEDEVIFEGGGEDDELGVVELGALLEAGAGLEGQVG